MVDKKKILRGAEIYGDTEINGDIDVGLGAGTSGISNFRHQVNFTHINVGSTAVPSRFNGDVIIDGEIDNIQFFALNRGGTDPITVVNNAGIIIPGSPNRYFINRSGLDQINITINTNFTDTSVWGEWFSGSGGGGTSCTVDETVSTLSRLWRGTFNTSLRWDDSNTGFTWTIHITDPVISALCGNELVTGLPIKTDPTGVLTLTELRIDGVATTVTTTENGLVLTINQTVPLTYSPLLLGTNKTFTLSADLEFDERAFTNQTTLEYISPLAALSISGSSLFDEGITTVNIARSLRGNPTTETRSAPTDWTFAAGNLPSTITIGGSGFTRADFDPGDASNRQITENYGFTNATDSSDTLAITRTATLNPQFTFPIYFGNTSSIANLDNTEVETFTKVAASTSDNQLPRQFSFSNSDATKNQNVILIRTSFSQGRDLAITMSDPAGNPQPFTTVKISKTLNIGRIAPLESYDVYNVVENQPATPDAVPAFARYL